MNQRAAIDEALRRDRRARLIADVRKSWWIVAALAIFLAAFTYWTSSPRQIVGVVSGVAVGAHQPQSETGRRRIQVSVELDEGGVVSVALPRNELYRAGA